MKSGCGYQDVECWVRQLRAAGWTAVIARHHPARFEPTEQTTTTWRSPNGLLYRGPYKAWKVMMDSHAETTNDSDVS